MKRYLLFLLCLFVPCCAWPQTGSDAELKYVLYVSRHGVRSPTGKAAQYNQYSAAAWPEWNVAPGYLTQHGYDLMKLFGAWDRHQLASEGLLKAEGCEQAGMVFFRADSDQRTRETAKAMAEGLFPGCAPTVHAEEEGVNDPLFHQRTSASSSASQALAVRAIAGRIGGDASNLTRAYHTELATLDHLLAHCGTAVNLQRQSLLDIPATLAVGKGDHLAELRGPLNTASTLTENLLLEYTQGMAEVGWGCVDGDTLRTLLALHSAASDYAQRTPVVARAQAENLLRQVERNLQQAASGKPVAGALGKPSDRALFLIGHDTNLSNLAGVLGLNWIADGRRDDTPPGAALVFELWQSHKGGEPEVRLFFTTQTLEQMRTLTPLDDANPPVRIPLFLTGCTNSNGVCTLSAFKQWSGRLLP